MATDDMFLETASKSKPGNYASKLFKRQGVVANHNVTKCNQFMSAFIKWKGSLPSHMIRSSNNSQGFQAHSPEHNVVENLSKSVKTLKYEFLLNRERYLICWASIGNDHIAEAVKTITLQNFNSKSSNKGYPL